MSEFRKVSKFKGTWLGRPGVSTDYLITSNPIGPRVVVHAWDDNGEVTVRGVDGDAYKNRRPFRETFVASFSRPSEAELSDAISSAKASLQYGNDMFTRYVITEGQIVKLFHDRPEDAFEPDEAPTEFLRDYCKWNDANGDYDEMDRRDLLAVVAGWLDDADLYHLVTRG